MLFIEDLSTLVIWLIALVMSLNFVFLFFVFYRRLSRKRYFTEKDAAKVRYQPTILQFVTGGLTVEAAATILTHATSTAEKDAVEQMLLAEVNRETAEQISQLFFALGYVEHWARTAFGRRRAPELIRRSLAREHAAVSDKPRKSPFNFIYRLRLLGVPRALALDGLGRLAPQYAQVFLAEGLHDPSFYVRRVAVENMGRNRFPEAVPLLIQELRRAVEQNNDVSLRTMKSALICYDLQDLEHFVPFLTQPNRRGRFFVIDTLREICNRAAQDSLLTKNDFSPALCKAVLEHCVVDEFEDVRARSAYIIKHFRDENSIQALRTLMRDQNEFVRLHSVRACANRFFVDLIPEIVSRLTDVRWRVREAAVGTLAALGPIGREQMYKFFISCADTFACEQITEEMQRNGLVNDLVASLAQGGQAATLAEAVSKKMALMGKTSLLLTAMATVASPEAKIGIMNALSVAPNEEYLAVLQIITANNTGPVRSRAGQLLRQFGVQTSYISTAGTS